MKLPCNDVGKTAEGVGFCLETEFHFEKVKPEVPETSWHIFLEEMWSKQWAL